MKKFYHSRSHGEIGIKFGKKYLILYYGRKINRICNYLEECYLKLFFKVIYYTVWSRDCDMCESTNAGIVYGEKRWDKMMDETGEWAEGPVNYNRISKEEYLDFVAPPVRDRIMEAYENGRGNSIYV